MDMLGFQDVNYVINIFEATISSISFLHHLFSKDNFQEIKIGDMTAVMLNVNSSSSVADLFEYLNHGVADAISKHFLQTMIFSIYTNLDDPSSVLQSYAFSLSYPDSKTIIFDFIPAKTDSLTISINFNSRSNININRSWCSLIRSLLFISHHLPVCPTKFGISIQLFNNSTTPNNYYPLGFKPFSFPISNDIDQCRIGYDAQIIIINEKKQKSQIENDPLFPLAFVSIYEEERTSFHSLGEILPGVSPHRIHQIFQGLEEVGLIEKKGNKRKVIRNQANRKTYLKILSNLENQYLN